MGVCLNEKRFEAPLIQMPAAGRVSMRMPEPMVPGTFSRRLAPCWAVVESVGKLFL